ncbi:MAG TPA: hypothetical protein VKY82_05645 [Flavobacterium sp.]|nr:hypothetical protein [Flavobacterium sp.]
MRRLRLFARQLGERAALGRSTSVNSVTTCGAETRIAVKLILNIYLMLNLLGFHHGNRGVEYIQSEGFTIIDIGYPQGLTTESLFYNMEINTINW